MSTLLPGDLVSLADALRQAYPTPGRAEDLLAFINESFAALTNDASDHGTRMNDAIADLASRGLVPALVAAAWNDPQQSANIVLQQTLSRFLPQTRWQLLDTGGFVMRQGPFIDRQNLRSALLRLFISRRVLQVMGSGTVRGRSWSCQLIEREAKLRGASYVKVDLRDAPLAGRESPVWLAETLHKGLFVHGAPPSIAGYAETRLVEPLLTAWMPTAPSTAVVVIDHVGDGNVKPPVREYVVSLALAVVEGKLDGLRLVLIDGPPGLDLSQHALHTAKDIVGPITAAHVTDFFDAVAVMLFPGSQPSERRALVDAAVGPLQPLLPGSASEELAIIVRDGLEEMALEGTV